MPQSDPIAPTPATDEAAATTAAAGSTGTGSKGAGSATDPGHPAAVVPDRLLPDAAADRRWRDRFSATRISLPDPATADESRAVFVSNESGRFELFCWDITGDRRMPATDRPDGTVNGVLSANGQGLWWFDDNDGDEFGQWMAQPFGSAPGSAGPAMPGVAPGYPAGLEVGLDVVVAGFNDDDGTRIHLRTADSDPVVVYRHETDAGVGGLSHDETIWVLAHTEHGDSRYPALRSLAVADGRVLAELDDSPGKGLEPLDFVAVPGDQRMLVGHERRGRDELLVWDAASGETTELDIDLPGDLSGCFFADGRSVLVCQSHQGRSTLYRYYLDSGALVSLPADPGVIDGALTRRDDSVWYRGSSGAEPATLKVIDPNGAAGGVLLAPPGDAAPGSRPLHDVWVDGPGGRIHAFLAVPESAPTPEPDGQSNTALPTVFLVHGGPTSADDDSFDATRATWLDAGFAVVQVNYRGSTGYGSPWRDALTQRVGHTELADIAAVHDHLVTIGIADVDRSVIAGASWGGYLTLLALGVQPGRWAAGVAGVPVADYPAAYQQEMEPLRAYDRALFGGSPAEVPDKYTDSSPLTWVDRVQVPVLILAGANDPRCPIGQIENYLDALAAQGAEYAIYRYDTGHGSMVVEERIRQVAVEIAFARDAVSRTA